MHTRHLLQLLILAAVACGGPNRADEDASNASGTSAPAREQPRFAYILQPNEGEVLGTDVIKASPNSGTQGSVMISQTMGAGFSTGRHVHLEADELFYVVSGEGIVSLGEDERPVSTGYVIFVPAGAEHRIRVEDGGQMEIIEFLDKPGLDEEFRVWHRRFSENPEDLSLEELNEVSRQYGTVYRSVY